MIKNLYKCIVFIFIMQAFFTSCGDDGVDKTPVKNPLKIKMYSGFNEGKWKGKAADHVPIISWLGKTRDKIKIVVPLEPTVQPRHYIEAIVLLKGKQQAMKQRFSFSKDKAIAIFSVSYNIRHQYKVVVKCNMHDMWITNLPD